MAKRRKVGYVLVAREGKPGEAMYAMLNELVARHHAELINARIAIAWNLTWGADVDGKITLGKCKRASDLDRELHQFDFVIMLQADFWQHAEVTDAERMALLDHELCHATVALDDDGEPMRDTKDRVVYRLRKHDVEEFEEIIRRHGCWKRDLERFAEVLKKSKQGWLPEITSGEKAVASLAHDPKVQRAVKALVSNPGDSVTFQVAGAAPVTLKHEDVH